MKNFFKNLPKFQNGKKKLIFLLLFLTILGFYWYISSDYVIIRFDELGSVGKNMNAYYNGFRVGRVISVEPDVDFKHVLAKLRFNTKNINLPQNTTVRVQSFPTGELYLELVYPQSPSLKPIVRGTVIEGIAQYNVEEFMQGQNVSGMTDIVTVHVVRTLKATEIANHEIRMFFQNASSLVNENRQGVKKSVDNTQKMTANLAKMAVNLNNLSDKLNKSIDEKALKQTTSNVKDSSDNIVKLTQDLDKTVNNIDATVDEFHAAAQHLNAVTSGLNTSLSKRFGGMRVMFGTPTSGKIDVKIKSK